MDGTLLHVVWQVVQLGTKSCPTWKRKGEPLVSKQSKKVNYEASKEAVRWKEQHGSAAVRQTVEPAAQQSTNEHNNRLLKPVDGRQCKSSALKWFRTMQWDNAQPNYILQHLK